MSCKYFILTFKIKFITENKMSVGIFLHVVDGKAKTDFTEAFCNIKHHNRNI